MLTQTFKNIDDVLLKEAGCYSELDYTEQSSWMLFLKYLDDLERERAMRAELGGAQLIRERLLGFRSICMQNIHCLKYLSKKL